MQTPRKSLESGVGGVDVWDGAFARFRNQSTISGVVIDILLYEVLVNRMRNMFARNYKIFVCL